MAFQRISILGVGLLGGSIGLAAKSAISGCQIIGYGHRPQTLEKALQIGAIDQAIENPAEAVRGCDLVILCTPVGVFPELIRQITQSLDDGAVMTDVGSTKRSIVRLAEQHLPAHVRFVASHPMAGSEKRGVEFARTDLFQNALCILTPTPATDPAAAASVGDFWKILGMRLTTLTPERHDELLSDVSHLPHALAAALVTMQDETALGLAGKGFLDTTRIAGGDGALWRDIFLDNRDNVRASLARLREKLEGFERLLDDTHADELAKWLDAAASRRAQWLQRKLREITPD